MAKRTLDSLIVSNTRLTDDYFILTLKVDTDLSEIRAGQFVQVRVDGSQDTFLRRPVSIYDVDHRERTLRLLIKIAGKGTSALSFLRAGDILNIILPLGNSFTIPPRGSRALLIGGGVGVAPLYLMGRTLKEKQIEFSFLLGYRSSDQIIEPAEFRAVGELLLATDDGTEGHHGIVTSHPAIKSGKYTHIFCCGPDPMMKGVAALARSYDLECEVSLENMMACGFGICLCCVEKTTRGNLNSCTDGPVFNIKELQWQI